MAGVAAAVTVLSGALLVGDFGPRQPAGSRAPATRPDRLVVVARSSSAPASLTKSASDPAFAADFESVVPHRGRPGRRHRAGERPPRCARAGVRRGRSLLAVPRQRADADSTARRGARCFSPALARELGAARRRHGARSASSGRRPSPSSRCTAARTMSAGRCGSRWAVSSRPPSSASSRSSRSRATSARLRAARAAAAGARDARPCERAARSARPGRRRARRRCEALVRKHAALEDLGLKLRALEPQRAARPRERRRPR